MFTTAIGAQSWPWCGWDGYGAFGIAPNTLCHIAEFVCLCQAWMGVDEMVAPLKVGCVGLCVDGCVCVCVFPCMSGCGEADKECLQMIHDCV